MARTRKKGNLQWEKREEKRGRKRKRKKEGGKGERTNPSSEISLTKGLPNSHGESRHQM